MGKDAIESSIIIDLFKEEYELDFEALNLQWIKKYFRVEEEDRKKVEHFSKQKEKDEKRALALRLNLKRRKNQLRKRVEKEVK